MVWDRFGHCIEKLIRLGVPDNGHSYNNGEKKLFVRQHGSYTYLCNISLFLYAVLESDF